MHCKWDTVALYRQSFRGNSLRAVTKSLSIECESQRENHFDEDIFAEFSNLQSLRIQKCRASTLPSALLRGLSDLRSLQLYSMASEWGSLRLPKGFFEGVPRLEKLSIIQCNLTALPDGALCDLPNIQVLNVSQNALQSAQLDNSAECPPLEQLIIADLSSNKILAVANDDLRRFVAIRQLILDRNGIEHIERDALTGSPLLQQLALEGNNLEELPVLPEHVTEVNVASNRLAIVPSRVANLAALKKLNIADNGVDSQTPFAIVSAGLEWVDLSQNRLEFLPETLLHQSAPSLLHLALAQNRITHIDALQFQNFSSLRSLDLSSNRLSEIGKATFVGLASLVELNLRNNSIYQVDSSAFNLTPQISEISFSRNLLNEVPAAIKRLFKLKRLDLSHNQIRRVEEYLFSALPHLDKLDFSHNRLTSVDSSILSELPRLTYLSLSHNAIDYLAEYAFAKCPKLQYLDLSTNFLANFNGALLTLPNLKHLNATANIVEILQWDEFPLNLAYLEMCNNRIALITSAHDSRIKQLVLDSNRIMALSKQQIPATIERLSLSDNLIQAVANDTFRDKSNVISVDLRYNRLTSVDFAAYHVDRHLNSQPVKLYVQGNPLICTCEMRWIRSKDAEERSVEIIDGARAVCTHRLSKRRISLSMVPANELLCDYKQICEPSCICCQYGNCDCKSRCPDGCECFRDASYTTNIVRCAALGSDSRRDFSPKEVPMYATHVFLEQMNFSTIRSHDFLGRTRLLQLHITNSSVYEIQPLAFNTLPSLQLLDLSNNLLSDLTGEEMYRLNKVTTLLLNGNRLTSINPKIRQMVPSLQAVFLHDNYLQDLPQAFENLGKQLTKISLSSNPFRCDCTPRFRIQRWLPQHSDRVVDAGQIYCVENVTKAIAENDTTVLSRYAPNHGDHIFMVPIAEFIAAANTTICAPSASSVFGAKSARASLLLITACAAVAFTVLAMLLFAIATLRRNRKRVAERRYKLPTSLSNSQATPGCGSNPQPLIQFDAFVSYSKKDEKLIADALCRQLESEEYSLCLLHRDGPHYNTRLHTISDELIRQMECAQSLILILTKYFLEEEWRTLQIKTSHQLFAKNRYKKLIAVLDDGIEPNQLDAELGQILRKNTCIRMNDPLFWTLLHSALPVKIAPSTCSADSSQIYSDCYGSIVPSDIV